MPQLEQPAALLARHLAAYGQLMTDDVANAMQTWRSRMIAACVLTLCAAFAVGCACVGVIAASWDTRWRLWSIAALGLVFLLATGLAAVRLRHLQEQQPPLLRRSAREWAKDRALLDELLAPAAGDAPLPADPVSGGAEGALPTLRRNREELRSMLSTEPAGATEFPRSRTLRWILGHLTAGAFASSALAAVLLRSPLRAWLLQRVLSRVGRARLQAASSLYRRVA